MKNLDQIFTLLANHEGISLNTDILETGLINIIVLIIILIYTGQDFLGSLLKERRITILKGVQDAEERLTEAKNRLEEAKKQLNQAGIITNEIKKESLGTKRLLLESEVSQTKKSLKISFDRGLATFRSKERQIFLEIKNKIITLVLQQTLIRAQATFKIQDRASSLLNETINKLKGDLL